MVKTSHTRPSSSAPTDHRFEPRSRYGARRKAHATRKGISLKKLFDKAWQTYKKQEPGA